VRCPIYFPYDSDISEDECDEDFAAAHGSLCIIDGHTVVGDSQIWISTLRADTYSFDTTSGAWSHAVDWKLPFRGRAEYLPELGLWFGFSSRDKHLCAVDLTSTASAMRPPVPRGSSARGRTSRSQRNGPS
jgi:hypothetical protein